MKKLVLFTMILGQAAFAAPKAEKLVVLQTQKDIVIAAKANRTEVLNFREGISKANCAIATPASSKSQTIAKGTKFDIISNTYGSRVISLQEVKKQMGLEKQTANVKSGAQLQAAADALYNKGQMAVKYDVSSLLSQTVSHNELKLRSNSLKLTLNITCQSNKPINNQQILDLMTDGAPGFFSNGYSSLALSK